MISSRANFSQKSLKIQIPKESLNQAYRLLLRYYPYESFPGKAINFLSKCVNETELNEENIVTRESVISNFVSQTGLPELFLRDDILLNQKDLKDHFLNRIIGQKDAVEKLCYVRAWLWIHIYLAVRAACLDGHSAAVCFPSFASLHSHTHTHPARKQKMDLQRPTPTSGTKGRRSYYSGTRL